MCLGLSRYFSRNTLSSPNDDLDSRLALSNDSSNLSSECTILIPLPPPPAVALIKSGKPIFLPSLTSEALSCLGP